MSSFYLPPYRGYTAVIKLGGCGHLCWYGMITNIPNDYVDFFSDTVSGIEAEFHKAVDNYIALCEDLKHAENPNA